MWLFLIGAFRSVIEMLGLCLIAQGVLALISGTGRQRNPIYRLFDLITSGPLFFLGKVLPSGLSVRAVGIICFVLLLFLWLGLAWIRKFN
ncbi:MAG: hypothetical protein D3M94_18380 [Rhodocyclales bacterium GT-UBC]|nr:MAG: hypothetical protein D3M94_18380 [Rhodocyclales bacterium GT-UBC]